MADEDDDAFTFGDFKFAPPPPPQSHLQSQSQPHINGVTSTSINNVDNLWGNFLITRQSSSSSSSSQSQFNNGFSPNPTNRAQPTPPIRVDPAPTKLQKPKGALPLSLFGEAEEDDDDDEGGSNENVANGVSDKGFDLKPQNGKFGVNDNGVVHKSEKENGFGLNFDGVAPDLIVHNHKDDNGEDNDVDDDDEWEFKAAFPDNGGVKEGNFKDESVVSGSKFEPFATIKQEKQAGQDAFSFSDTKPGSINLAPQSIDLFASSYGNGSNNQSNGLNVDFGSSTSTTNGIVKPGSINLAPQSIDLFASSYGNGSNNQSNGLNVDFGAITSTTNGIVKPGSINLTPQSIDLFSSSYGNGSNNQSNGLNVDFGSSTSTTNGIVKPGSITFAPQSVDLFASSYENGSNHQSNGLNVDFGSSTSTTNGLVWDPFSGVKSIGNGSGTNASLLNQDDNSDDFDFGDFVDASQEVGSKEQGQVAVQINPVEAQLPNGEVEEKQTQTEHSRGALPLSFFSDVTEESGDGLDLQDEVIHKATLAPGNSSCGQASAISINDLISNLYSQAQPTSSVKPTEKPAENGVLSPQKVTGITPLVDDDDWDDGSWEFKGAISENGVSEHLSTAISANVAQKQSGSFPELHDYTEFYIQMKDSLCSLLSSQLDELKKARNSDAVTANGEKSGAIDDEIQEAFRLLEETVKSKEVLQKKDLQKESCLNKLLEVLQQPTFNVIESDFQLSKRLQLAEKEWRIASELLRHAISMLKILSLGSNDEQSHYASTWSKIINACVQELRHGASIWKRASEKNMQCQILLDSRGQQNVLALGEIYKVVKLLGLSAKVYKPLILPRVSDSSQFFGVLDECDAIWSNIGLEEAIQSLSDNVDFGCNGTAGALIASIKNIHGIDVLSLHDRVFIRRKPICQLSLLPQDTLADLKTVTWGEKAYLLNLANLWANLISCEPPQLPPLQVC